MNIQSFVLYISQEKLKMELNKNEQLQRELEEAKKEVMVVKKRNKTLCNMLSQGESNMKNTFSYFIAIKKIYFV